MAIETIVFDVGGVLALENGWRQIFEELGIPYPHAEKGAWNSYKVGRIHELQYWKVTLAGTIYEERVSKVASMAREWYASSPAGGAACLVPELQHMGYSLAVLSNHVTEWVRPFLQRNKLDCYFGAIIVSSEVGLAKPDPRIYEVLQNALPRRGCALLIDDKLEKVVAAQHSGLSAVQYTPQLLRDLRAHGIMI